MAPSALSRLWRLKKIQPDFSQQTLFFSLSLCLSCICSALHIFSIQIPFRQFLKKHLAYFQLNHLNAKDVKNLSNVNENSSKHYHIPFSLMKNRRKGKKKCEREVNMQMSWPTATRFKRRFRRSCWLCVGHLFEVETTTKHIDCNARFQFSQLGLWNGVFLPK